MEEDETKSKFSMRRFMAYCRWSSEDYQCDLYCYESKEGYVTKVATYIGKNLKTGCERL